MKSKNFLTKHSLMRGFHCFLLILFLAACSSKKDEKITPPEENKPETWIFNGKIIGKHNDTGMAFAMPAVLTTPEGLRLFYNTDNGDFQKLRVCIKYAETTDEKNWNIKGVAIWGAVDTFERNFNIGGGSFVKTKDGKIRMYLRCAPKNPPKTPPLYHIRSAISDDGINFKDEGVRLDIQPFDPKSPFKLAGHGVVYQLPDKRYAIVLSANEDPRKPSDLYLGISEDEGLSFGNFKKIFPECHDPSVVYYKGEYIMYAMLLRDYCWKSTSKDGITWSPYEKLTFKDANGKEMPLEGNGYGDIGAVVNNKGELLLFSNIEDVSGNGIAFWKIEN